MKKNFLKGVALALAVVIAATAVGVGVPAQAAKKRRSQITIGIDPGHQQGGDLSKEANGPGSRVKKYKVSYGTSGRYSKIPEYQVTLAVGKKLQKELKVRGYNVVMTRTKNNVNISNKNRALKLNKSCDIAVRLHCDGAGASAHGASMQCSSKNNPYYIGKLYSQCNKLSKSILNAYCKKTGISKIGTVYRDDLTGTNWSTIPVTLIEMGFMTNRNDDLYMSKSANQTKMAKGIADGIDAYFGF